jgi:hypothetical protein
LADHPSENFPIQLLAFDPGCIIRELCITHISLKRMDFSSVPRLLGWSFQQRICGAVLPPPHCPDKSRPAVSPTDTLRKDSALTPVTSEKSTLFIGVTKTCPVESPKGGPAEREFHRVNKVLQSSKQVRHDIERIVNMPFCACPPYPPGHHDLSQ